VTRTQLASSAVVVTALVLAASWLFRWPLEKAAILAPIIVVVAGATVGLVVLWAKVIRDSLRGRSD
jgi:intracellular septation protein A